MALTQTELLRAFYENGTERFNYGYHKLYEDLFAAVPNVTKLLEIGIRRGRSLAAWKDLFPDASLTGVDIHEYGGGIVEKAQSAQIIYMDSARTAIAEQVGTGYDIIIDDGDHRIDWQTQTFMNLRECWTKAYVIENIINLDQERVLRRRLNSMGYTRLSTYTSSQQNITMRISGEDKAVTFYAMVVLPRLF